MAPHEALFLTEFDPGCGPPWMRAVAEDPRFRLHRGSDALPAARQAGPLDPLVVAPATLGGRWMRAVGECLWSPGSTRRLPVVVGELHLRDVGFLGVLPCVDVVNTLHCLPTLSELLDLACRQSPSTHPEVRVIEKGLATGSRAQAPGSPE